jgi:hypothetical protein
MSTTRSRLGLRLLSLALAVAPAFGAERVERTLDLTQPLPRGSKLNVENLVGAIVVRGDRTGGRAVAHARVVVEAETWNEANSIAQAIALAPETAGGTTSIRVTYPVDRFSAFKVPRGEKSGLMEKWVTPLIHKTTVAAQYGGKSVEVGSSKGAAAVAVYLEINVPLEIEAKLRQTVGTVQASGVRGKFDLEVVEGQVIAEQVYGTLHTRTGGGDVVVRKFTGPALEVQTASGRLDLVEIAADETRVQNGTGEIQGSTITTKALHVENGTGEVRLAGLDAVALDVSSGSGPVDLGVRITRTRQATVKTDSGDVVLRVSPTTPFALRAESGEGSVEHKAIAAEVLDLDKNRVQLKRGQGGADLKVTSTKGDVLVRSS